MAILWSQSIPGTIFSDADLFMLNKTKYIIEEDNDKTYYFVQRVEVSSHINFHAFRNISGIIAFINSSLKD